MAVLTTGCSSTSPRSAASPSPRPSPSPPPPVPDRWSTHFDIDQGFSVPFPDAWDFAFRDSSVFDADLKTLGRRSPELAAFFRRSFTANPQLRLLAADSRGLPRGFASNVNVITSDLGTPPNAATLEELTTAKLKYLRQQPAVISAVTRTPDRLAGRPAVRLDYNLKAGEVTVQVRSLLAIVPRGKRNFMFELTMGTPAEEVATNFDVMIQHFALFPPVAAPSPSPTTSPTASPTPSARSG
jgi:hypothetical protein